MLSYLFPLLLLPLAAASPEPPRLTVVISIDQFRADYLSRFSNLYLPAKSKAGVGGFLWLMETGASFVNARYTHVPTETGPGHAIIATGSTPSLTGIVANDWFDRKAGRLTYCVRDPAAEDVLTSGPSFSPKNLEVSTFGDELKRATAGKSKHVSIALKDRASILMAGRLADDVIWFDLATGSWTSSTFYEPDRKLPAWVVKINDRKIPDKDKGRSWTRSLSAAAYERTGPPDKPGVPVGFGAIFPHQLPDENRHYNRWVYTPWANEFVFTTAKAGVKEVGLGRDEVPDILTISLSTNDYVGHAFGPDSPEVLEVSVQTDRQLSDFFRFLDAEVKGGLESVLIVVTADHGVLPMPEELTKRGLPGGRVSAAGLLSALKSAVKERFGSENLVAAFDGFMVYLDEGAVTRQGEGAREDVAIFIRDHLRAIPEVFMACTRFELDEGMLPDGAVPRMLARSFHRQNSGDVFFFLKPGFLLDSWGTGTAHGSPWSYDTAVPLLMRGPWVSPGRHLDVCGPEDIAATVCAVLGIGLPSGNVGRAIGLKQ